MKVKIKTWNAVAAWHWDLPDDDVCVICQVPYDGTCPTCRYPGDDCVPGEPHARGTAFANALKLTRSLVVSGNCGHSFHDVSHTEAVDSDESISTDTDLWHKHCMTEWMK